MDSSTGPYHQSDPAPGHSGHIGQAGHARFLALVSRLQGSICTTEISYLDGRVVLRTTPGSVRLDVVAGHPAAPVRTYEIRTGHKALPSARLKAIRRHLHGRGKVPVVQLRP